MGGVMDIGLGHYLTVSAILLVLGIFGIFLNSLQSNSLQPNSLSNKLTK